MAGTFSQQLQQKNAQQQQGMASRTQRKLATEKYTALSREAERLRSDVFIDKTTTETYSEFVPAKYIDRHGNIMNSWYRLSQRQKDNEIKATYSYGSTHLVEVKKTRSVTDPFTFEEYGQEYQKLSPDLQQFFVSPQAITTQQQQKKAQGISQIDTRIIQLRQQITDNQKRKEEYQRWWDQLREKDKENQRDNYRNRMHEYEWDMDQYQNEISQLESGKGKVNEGYEVGDVMSYATQYANAQRDASENRMQQRTEFNKELASGKMDADLVKLGLNKEGLSFEKFQEKVGSYNKDVAYMQQLGKWSGKVGFANLPQWTKETLNKPAMDWQKSNPSEVLQFDAQGNVTAIQSTQFGGKTYSIADYNKRIEEFSKADTSITYGEKEKQSNQAMISASKGQFTQDEKYLNEFYGKKSALQTVIDKGGSAITSFFTPFAESVSNILGLGKTPPELQKETTITAPTGMGGKGTVITKTDFTPETVAYMGEINRETKAIDKVLSEVNKTYETKLFSLENVSQENINVLKKEAQGTFTKNITAEFKISDEIYQEELEKIKRNKKWAFEKIAPIVSVPVTQLRSWYYRQEDAEKYLKDTVKIPTQQEMETETFRKFTQYRSDKTYGVMSYSVPKGMGEKGTRITTVGLETKKGMPLWLAKELASDEEFVKGVYYGGKVAVLEHPKTFVAKTGLWAVGTAGVMVVSTYTGGLGGLATSSAFKMAMTGAGLLYAGSIVVRTANAPTFYEKGKTFGTIVGEELAPMLIGGAIGSYVGMKTTAGIDALYYKYLKRNQYKYRTSYKITEMEQLTGEKRFTLLKKGETQKRAFEKLDANYLTPDEMKILRKGGTVERTTTHATSTRTAFRKKITTIKAEGRELQAISVANKRLSKNFLDLEKTPKASLYSSQAIPTGSTPLGMRIKVQAFGKIPKGYKSSLSIKELEKVLGTVINPKYFKYTSFLYEKGQFGTAYTVGRYGLKQEVEAYLKGGGDLIKTQQQKYYTQIAKESFYKKLTGFQRKGYQEYALKVQKFSVIKPSTWIDRITPKLKALKTPVNVLGLHLKETLVFGKQIGSFKPMKRGRVVPIGRFEAMTTGNDVADKIRKLLASKPRTEAVNILKQQRITQTSKAVSSAVSPFKISASYPSSYALQSYLSRKSTPKSVSVSYKKSYGYSTASSPSYLKSAISSLLSTPSKPSKPSFPSYPSKPSFPSYPSYPSTPSYPRQKSYPKLKLYGEIKERLWRRRKVSPEIQGLMPDFTARALGIAPKEVSLKQALREIAKVQTGFGIRRGARIKGLNEKNIMRQIMR